MLCASRTIDIGSFVHVGVAATTYCFCYNFKEEEEEGFDYGTCFSTLYTFLLVPLLSLQHDSLLFYAATFAGVVLSLSLLEEEKKEV